MGKAPRPKKVKVLVPVVHQRYSYQGWLEPEGGRSVVRTISEALGWL